MNALDDLLTAYDSQIRATETTNLGPGVHVDGETGPWSGSSAGTKGSSAPPST